jgi:MFS family permease
LWASAAQAAISVVGFGLPSIGPELVAEFGLSLSALGAVLTAGLLGSGVALFPAGRLVDRHGGRSVAVAGSALGASGLAGAAFAPGTSSLVALLFVAGVGLAAVPIAGMGSLFRIYGPERRGFALGVRQMAVPLGGVVGALVLPALEAAGGVRLALAACALAVGATGLRFASIAGPAPPAGERPPPSSLRRIWQAPGMPRLLGVAALYIAVLQSLLAYSVPSARAAGLSPFAAGAAFVVLNVTAGVARVVWGRIADGRGGERRVQALVGAGAVGSGGAVVFAFALHAGAAAVIAAVVLFAFGALGWNALVYVSAGERSPPELAGQSVAVAATLVFVLSAAVTPAMGVLADRAGWDALWLTTAGLAAAGAAVAAGLAPSQREPAAA